MRVSTGANAKISPVVSVHREKIHRRERGGRRDEKLPTHYRTGQGSDTLGPASASLSQTRMRCAHTERFAEETGISAISAVNDYLLFDRAFVQINK